MKRSALTLTLVAFLSSIIACGDDSDGGATYDWSTGGDESIDRDEGSCEAQANIDYAQCKSGCSCDRSDCDLSNSRSYSNCLLDCSDDA
jgi:hypothetical protein